ncbi:unnamed protein product [Paramecium primaurelia]|uniref:Uncharacterized protein n=1 Tax=Paramecium primaurelia TaxID=5886 RepID=A0A8S1MG68_PARPR|nr:unnamed protein product [Paramecium primaurelia]
MIAQEKSIQEKRSNIFYESTKLPKSLPKYIEDRPKSPNLDHRQRMLYQNTSNVLSGYCYQKIKQVCESRIKIVEDPNNRLKHQNQNFSDYLIDIVVIIKQIKELDQFLLNYIGLHMIVLEMQKIVQIMNIQQIIINQNLLSKLLKYPIQKLKCIQQAKELKNYSKLHGKTTSSKEIVYEGMLKWKNNYK